jgi:hypothetical protein
MKTIVNLAKHYKNAPSDQSIFIFNGDYSRLHLKVLEADSEDYVMLHNAERHDRLGYSAKETAPITLQTDQHYQLVFCEFFTYEPCNIETSVPNTA